MLGVFKVFGVVSVFGSSSVLYYVLEFILFWVWRKSLFFFKGGFFVVFCMLMIVGVDCEGGGFFLWMVVWFVDICFCCLDWRIYKYWGFFVFIVSKNDCVMWELVNNVILEGGGWFFYGEIDG